MVSVIISNSFTEKKGTRRRGKDAHIMRAMHEQQSVRNFTSHPLIHTIPEFSLAQYIVALNAAVVSAAYFHKQATLSQLA